MPWPFSKRKKERKGQQEDLERIQQEVEVTCVNYWRSWKASHHLLKRYLKSLLTPKSATSISTCQNKRSFSLYSAISLSGFDGSLWKVTIAEIVSRTKTSSQISIKRPEIQLRNEPYFISRNLMYTPIKHFERKRRKCLGQEIYKLWPFKSLWITSNRKMAKNKGSICRHLWPLLSRNDWK